MDQVIDPPDAEPSDADPSDAEPTAAQPTDAEAVDAIPVGSGPGHSLGVAAAWIGVGLIVGLALWLFWTNVVNAEGSSVVDSYAAGDGGHRYGSVRDGFKVEMPTKPTRRTRNGPEGRTVVVESRPAPGYTFSVIREPQPESALEHFTVTLDTAAGSLAAQVGGEIVTQTEPAPYGDVAVKRLVFRKGNEYYRNMLLLSTAGLYTIQAKVKGDDPKPFHQLWKSFSVLGAR